LVEFTARERITVHEVCAVIDTVKPPGFNLTIAARLGVLRDYRDAATERGHANAGHGNAHH
jgi:hypothetical protein